jgi:hypothetical protein
MQLCVRFPALFSHALDVHVSVRAVMLGGLDCVLVPRLTPVGAVHRGIVAGELVAVSLTAAPHYRALARCAKPCGGIDTGALYRLWHFGGAVDPFVWENAAPSKVRFFGWLLVQARIPSRASLLKKGILSTVEACCPICQAPAETVTHIIFGCAFGAWF